jgi:DNA-binding XRE family transcriptional regulator
MAGRSSKFKDFLKEQLKDPEFKKHYDAYDLPVRLAIEIAVLRRDKKLTQAALARKMGVSQQMVAQIENPSGTPSIKTLQKVALALGKSLNVTFQ